MPPFLSFIKKRLKKYRKTRKKPRRKSNSVNYLEHKSRALTLVHERLIYYNTFYNFKYNKVSVKNVKTRWGSCSSKGNINFSYRIALLPPELADYIIVHELCHLGQMNHSRAFWDLVAKTIPKYKEYRKMLRKQGSVV